jgi:arylsulfatase A-like enzyme
LIYADDLGFGDLGCYGARGVATPNVDRLAREGLRFVNGYATSSTCTPSRFSILTGRYAFRQTGTGILPGNAPLIIQPGSATLPAVLQRAGYTTAVVGKWHLGLGATNVPLDWNGEIKPGPLEVGFDHCFIFPATADRVPCVYVEDHRVLNLDPADPIRVSYQKPLSGEVAYKDVPRTALKMISNSGHQDTVINGIGRIGHMTGGRAALWKDEDLADDFIRRAVQFIEKERERPFFLFFAAHDVHVPRAPHPRFVGQSRLGLRGDQIVEFDWSVGRILETLDRLNLTDQTLVILSSDNGPVLDDGYDDEANEKLGEHRPAGPLRGGKYSIFEGGTRVPLIVRWPGQVKPGVSSALISQVDFTATFAAMVGQRLAPEDAPDSQSVGPALLGHSPVGRTSLVEYGLRREKALRAGDWKYIPPARTQDGLGPWRNVSVPPPGFLFNLVQDPGETNDLAATLPERVATMSAELAAITNPVPRRASAPPAPVKNTR